MKTFVVCILTLALGASAAMAAAAAPKRLLVVTASTGFRHSSIEITEKVIRELAAKSGDFVVISTMDHPDYPDFTNSGLFGNQVADGTPGQQTFIRRLNDRINSPFAPMQAAILAARSDVIAASLSGSTQAVRTSVDALVRAESALATAKAAEFQRLQAADNRLTDHQVLVLRGLAQSAAPPRTAFAPQVGAATPLQQKAIAAANAGARFTALVQSVANARSELATTSLADPRNTARIAARAAAVAAAEQALATARADEFARIQATAGRFTPEVRRTLVSRFALPETGNTTTDGVAKVFADMLSVDALGNYDGVFFVSSVGTLPFPDLDGFIQWVADGGSWSGSHGSSDAMHGVNRYFEMMGGEFTGHGAQTREVMTVIDMDHPIGRAIGSRTLTVYDEMYTFENAQFDHSRVRNILAFTTALNDGMHSPVGAPGLWPSTWVKMHGNGRVFYTALGHREDVVDPNYNLSPRMNEPEVAMAYQRMLHAGIRWSLGLIEGAATPQIRTPTPAGGAGVSRPGRGGG